MRESRRLLVVNNDVVIFDIPIIKLRLSVFELLINTDTLKKLAKRLEGLIDRTEDRVRFYVLCNACCQRIAILGTGKLSEGEDVYVY